MQKNIQELLTTYPRIRKPLPPEYELIYTSEYILNREGKSFITYLSMKLENWLHYAILDKKNKYTGNILELGAGTLNHIPFELPFSADYDIVEPFKELYIESLKKEYVNKFFENIYDIPVEKKYSRIISKAVLEHITDLPALIAYSTLILRENGIFQASIPSEGSLLWKLCYTTTTGLAYRLRTGLDYSVLMRHEHINNAYEIEQIIRYFYTNVTCKRFLLPCFHGSIYSSLWASSPDLKKAEEYLASIK